MDKSDDASRDQLSLGVYYSAAVHNADNFYTALEQDAIPTADDGTLNMQAKHFSQLGFWNILHTIGERQPRVRRPMTAGNQGTYNSADLQRLDNGKTPPLQTVPEESSSASPKEEVDDTAEGKLGVLELKAKPGGLVETLQKLLRLPDLRFLDSDDDALATESLANLFNDPNFFMPILEPIVRFAEDATELDPSASGFKLEMQEVESLKSLCELLQPLTRQTENEPSSSEDTGNARALFGIFEALTVYAEVVSNWYKTEAQQSAKLGPDAEDWISQAAKVLVEKVNKCAEPLVEETEKLFQALDNPSPDPLQESQFDSIAEESPEDLSQPEKPDSQKEATFEKNVNDVMSPPVLVVEQIIRPPLLPSSPPQKAMWGMRTIVVSEPLGKAIEASAATKPEGSFLEYTTTTPGFVKITAHSSVSGETRLEQIDEEFVKRMRMDLPKMLEGLEIPDDPFLQYSHESLDVGFKCQSWPRAATNIFRRKDNQEWPPEEALFVLKISPPLLTPTNKGPTTTPGGKAAWMFNFCVQTRILMQHAPENARRAYVFFKKVVQEKCSVLTDELLMSVFFSWLTQNWTGKLQSSSRLSEILLGLYDTLLTNVQRGCLSCFFIPEHHFLDGLGYSAVSAGISDLKQHFESLDMLQSLFPGEESLEGDEALVRCMETSGKKYFEVYRNWIYPAAPNATAEEDSALAALKALFSAAECLKTLKVFEGFDGDSDDPLFELLENVACHCFQQEKVFPFDGHMRVKWHSLGEDMLSILMRQQHPSPGLFVEVSNVLMRQGLYDQAMKLLPSVKSELFSDIMIPLIATWTTAYDVTLSEIVEERIGSLLTKWRRFRAPSLAVALYLRCKGLKALGKPCKDELDRLYSIVKLLAKSTDESDKERLAATMQLLSFATEAAGFQGTADESATGAEIVARHVGLISADTC